MLIFSHGLKPESLPHDFHADSGGAYRRRLYRKDFKNLDPAALPWTEMRRTPERFPDVHMAKISSVRTVAGFTFETAEGKKEKIYVKKSFVQDAWRKLVARLRPPKEWREFRLAQEFQAHGVRVPEPVFYAEAKLPENGYPVTFYATMALPEDFCEARGFFHATGQFREEWISLGEFTAMLHGKGIYHADYRAAHQFFARRDGKFEWALIDLDHSRTGHRVGRPVRRRAILQLVQSLMGAGITENDVNRFVAAYDPEDEWKLRPGELFREARGRWEDKRKARKYQKPRAGRAWGREKA